MRVPHRRATALASAAVLLTGLAIAAEVRAEPAPADEIPTPVARDAENFGASCRTVVEGSRVTAHCQNPYPTTDRVRLHVECERWWDVDTDSAPVDVGPAAYAQLTGRCWKEVRSAWLTHQPADPPPLLPQRPEPLPLPPVSTVPASPAPASSAPASPAPD